MEAGGDDTARTTLVDAVRGPAWPTGYDGRVISNPFLQRWHGHEDELLSNEAERRRFLDAAAAGRTDVAHVWAGEGIDLVTSLPNAGDLVHAISAEARHRIATANPW